MNLQLYDVVAVNLRSRTVRLLATEKTGDNATAIVAMAVGRRGVMQEFYSEVLSGRYEDGDTCRFC